MTIFVTLDIIIVMIPNIMSVTEARSILGNLAETVSGEQFVLLTKGGRATAELVDVNYLDRLQKQVKALWQKTYIDSTLLPYTREFSDEETAQWEKEDQL